MERSAASAIRLQQSPVLVGRRDAVQLLSGAVLRAVEGEPSVVLISGEAGVGKTRLAREAMSLAEAAGAALCVGRCIEGSRIPYLPFVNGLLPCLEQAGLADNHSVLRLLRPGAISDGGIELEDRAPELFFAVPRAAFELAAVRPLLLVIEDLHWADTSTLGVLEHLVLGAADESTRQRLPLCVVITCREASPAAGVGRLMARLAREQIVESIPLNALSELELNELVLETAGHRPSPGFLSALHAASGGNPLFALETLRLMASDNALRDEAGQLVAPQLDSLNVYNDITAALDDRVLQLENDAADLLTLAALAGDDVPSSLLAAAAELSLDRVDDLLEQPFREGFVTLTNDGVKFTHPLVRKSFVRRWRPGRRRAAHLAIARALKDTSVPAAELEIGEHMFAAGQAADPRERAEALIAAADAALSMRAWGEAARYYQACCEHNEYVDGLPPQERAHLLYRRGLAAHRNNDPSAAESLLSAARLFRQEGDALGQADALVAWSRHLIGTDAAAARNIGRSPEIQSFFDEVEADAPLARARMEAQVADMLFAANGPEAREYASRAVEGAESTGDLVLHVHAANSLGLALWQDIEPEKALDCFRQALEAAKAYGDPWYQGWPLQRMPLVLVALGRLKEAETFAADAALLAGESHDWAGGSLAHSAMVALSYLRECDQADDAASEASLMYHRSGYAWSPAILYPALFQAGLMMADYPGARRVATLWQQAGGHTGSWLMRLLLLAHEGRFDALNTEAATYPHRLVRPYPLSMGSLGLFALRAEIATMAGLPEIAETAREPLAEALARGVVFSVPQGVFLIPRLLGDIAAQAGDLTGAVGHYEHALSVARVSRANTELARTCFNFATLLARNPGLAESRWIGDLSTEAHELFSSMSMTSWAAKAADLARSAGAHVSDHLVEASASPARDQVETSPGAQAPGLRVVLVSDVVSSTKLNQQLGDAAWVKALEHYNEVVRKEIRRYAGVEIKQTGDGILAWFSSAADAVACASAFVTQFPISEHDIEISVCAGISAGEPIQSGDDLLGLSVTEAFRICDRAGAGEVLVSDAVCQLLRGSQFEFAERGRAMLKGFKGRARLHRLVLSDADEGNQG